MGNLDDKLSRAIADWAQASEARARIAVFMARWPIFALVAAALILTMTTSGIWFPFALVFSFFPGVVVPWLFTLVLEFLVRRKRPYEAQAVPLNRLRIRWYTPSFPSGHATLAFASVGYLFAYAENHWDQALVVWLALAVLVSLSRIAVRVHYPSDVIVGAFIGFLGSIAITNWMFAFFSSVSF